MNFHDTRETRDPEARERELLSRLPAQIAHARAAAPAFGRLLADVDPDSVTSREALATLPVTRKSELLELQKAARPFGGFSAVGWGAAVGWVIGDSSGRSRGEGGGSGRLSATTGLSGPLSCQCSHAAHLVP